MLNLSYEGKHEGLFEQSNFYTWLKKFEEPEFIKSSSKNIGKNVLSEGVSEDIYITIILCYLPRDNVVVDYHLLSRETKKGRINDKVSVVTRGTKESISNFESTLNKEMEKIETARQYLRECKDYDLR